MLLSCRSYNTYKEMYRYKNKLVAGEQCNYNSASMVYFLHENTNCAFGNKEDNIDISNKQFTPFIYCFYYNF